MYTLVKALQRFRTLKQKKKFKSRVNSALSPEARINTAASRK